MNSKFSIPKEKPDPNMTNENLQTTRSIPKLPLSSFPNPDYPSKTSRNSYISPKKPLSELPQNIAATPCPTTRTKPTSLQHSSSTCSNTKRQMLQSPKLSIEDLKNDENYPIKLFQLPMTGTRVMALYRGYLTEHECKEVRSYVQVFYFGHKVHKLSEFSDSNGGYRAVAGDHLAYRYEMLELIGRGTFGHVYKCFDYKHEQLVAVKIIRRGVNIRKQGENEVKVLESLNEQDPDMNNIVKLLNCFEFRQHLCIAYELLSINLYQFLRKNQFRGTNISQIKRIASQVLISLKYIHSQGYFHCDLKLENILLKSESKTSIKVIDFGSAIGLSNPMFTYLQSRYYRAPEVILGCGYDCKIDLWSLGCILIELFTGRPVFPGDNEKDQLFRIIYVLGMPPNEILDKANRKNVFLPFEKTVKMKWSLNDLINPSNRDEELFEEFVGTLLQWDPDQRPSADQALKHVWIKGKDNSGMRESVVKGRLLFNS